MFSREAALRLEQSLFSSRGNRALEEAVATGHADIAKLSSTLALLVTARITGIDVVDDDRAAKLVKYNRILNDGVNIEDYTGDPARLKRRVMRTLRSFERDFLVPSRRARERGGNSERSEPSEPAADLLTLLIENKTKLELNDATVAREAAFFLESGSHTSGQSAANALHFLFGWCPATSERSRRLGQNLDLVQRCVHEALRLRPVVPVLSRRAVRDTEVAGRSIRAGSVVYLDVAAANRDVSVFGSDADCFNPDRVLSGPAQRYGHSFSSGMHSCIGRALAVGLSPRAGSELNAPTRLVGVVTLLIRRYVQLGVQPHPTRRPKALSDTRRWTIWERYPVAWSRQTAMTDAANQMLRGRNRPSWFSSRELRLCRALHGPRTTLWYPDRAPFQSAGAVVP